MLRYFPARGNRRARRAGRRRAGAGATGGNRRPAITERSSRRIGRSTRQDPRQRARGATSARSAGCGRSPAAQDRQVAQGLAVGHAVTPVMVASTVTVTTQPFKIVCREHGEEKPM